MSIANVLNSIFKINKHQKMEYKLIKKTNFHIS